MLETQKKSNVMKGLIKIILILFQILDEISKNNLMLTEIITKTKKV